MSKLTFTVAAIAFALSSCSKKVEKPLSKQEIQRQIDSIAGKRMAEMERAAQIELEHRIKIEVKVKADSILQEKFRMAAQAKQDSTLTQPK